MARLTRREQACFRCAVLNKLHFDDFRGGGAGIFFAGAITALYYGRIRPSWLPLRTVERKCARLDAGSASPAAPVPWRCGARPVTTWLGQTTDESPFGPGGRAKYVSATPSGATASRRRPIATCRQWAPSRPGVTSAANYDELRSNTARYGSLQGGLGALGSGGLLHATQLCLGRVGSAGVSVAAASTGTARRARREVPAQRAPVARATGVPPGIINFLTSPRAPGT